MARSNAIAKIREIAESNQDPKLAIRRALGDAATRFQVFHSQVLVATYIQPAQTKGGIFIPDKSLQEDQFQGTVGLVVALGPGAFKDDNIAKFHGLSLKVGDWCLYRPSDGLQLYVREVPCRLFEDVNIKMRILDPQMFW